MSSNRLKKPAFLLVLSLFTTLFSSPAHAFKFNIDSPKITVEVNAGEKYAGYITVDSYGYDEDLAVHVYVEDVIYLPDGTNDFLPKGSTKWSLANWLKVEPREFLLKGNSSSMVRYTISVPADAKGGRYGVVFFEVDAPPTPGSAARSSIRVGSIIALSVKGRVGEYKAELTALKAHFDEDKKLAASCVIKNLSDALIRPAGEFIILDKEGTELAKKDVNPVKGGVLPGTSRRFEAKWEEPAELEWNKGGDYILQVTIDYGGKSLLGGQTHLKLKDE